MIAIGGAGRHGKDEGGHCTEQISDGGSVLAHVRKPGTGAEARPQHRGGAGNQSAVKLYVEAIDMEQRHRDVVNVAFGDRMIVDKPESKEIAVGMRQQYALGGTGGARCVYDAGDVPGRR